MLVRTQIMLDDQIKRDLEYLSEVKNQSMSSLVRKFVAEKVKIEKKRVKRVKKMDPVKALLGLAKRAEEIDKKYGFSGPTDWSINHDHYLYGSPKRKK
ncbi:hypothetical protein HY407_04980 [Candidatus Gottesmanbacteria bacterium]|nr:hypothetical protein [Candidatus Gottesmanbacteria bacterium]